MEPLTVRQLEGFVVTAEELHFGRAAARLEVSQPSLSQLIGRIEEALGAELFHRRPRVRLTEAGALLLPNVTEALRVLGRGAAGVRELVAGTAGHLTVRFAASALVSPFPDVLRRFRAQFPSVRVELLKGSSASIRADLDSDEIGVARYSPEEAPRRAVVLAREPFVLALPAGHRLVDQERIDLPELKAEPFIHFPRREAPDLHDEIAGACQSAGFAPRVVLEGTEWLTIMGFVRSGLGLAFVPASFQGLRWEGAEYRPFAEGAPTSVVAAWHSPHVRSPAVQLFMKEARRGRAQGTA